MNAHPTWNDADRLLPTMHTEAVRAGYPYRPGTLTLDPGTPARLRWAHTLDVHASIPGGDTLADTPAECVDIIRTRTEIYRELAQAIEHDMEQTTGRIHPFPKGAS
jgi:metal-dependent amidase/aminoacylase/carboxypeptidase family protein